VGDYFKSLLASFGVDLPVWLATGTARRS